jgi:hypothetical protein
MKMADILRGLADKLDSIESNVQSEVEPPAEPKAQELDDNPVMVPPLQAKLELLKKATGVDNVYSNNGSDELDDIKKLTGIKAVVQHEASEDNDITG